MSSYLRSKGSHAEQDGSRLHGDSDDLINRNAKCRRLLQSLEISVMQYTFILYADCPSCVLHFWASECFASRRNHLEE